MLTIAALRQQKIDEKASLKAARTEAAGLYGVGALSPEQETLKASLKARIAASEARIESLDEAIENAEALARTEAEGASETAATDGPVTMAAKDDPKKGFKSHREFLVAVMDSGRGVRQDKRLALVKGSPMKATVGSDEHSIASNPNGGFLVPEGFAPGLLMRGVENDPFAGVTNVPMDVPTLNFTARVDANHSSSVSGGLSVSRRLETGAFSSSRMSFDRFQLNATALTGLTYASEELLSFSPQSFAALAASGFGDEFLAKKIDERLNGGGAGEPEGIMNSPALISVAKEAGQAADTITYNNILAMWARCWGKSNAVWIANHDCIETLAKMSFVVGTGGSAVFVPNTAPATLLGRPIYFTEYAKTVGDTGDILLINPSQYLWGTLQPLQSAESVHVRFENHERTFKFWEMNDGKSWWRAALTPKNSSNTLSPFVKLDARA